MCKGRDQSCSEPVRGIGDCGRKCGKRTAAYACSGGANQEIVLCGSIAAEGVLRIFDEKREELSKRFVPAFMGQIQGIESELEVFHALRSVKQENTPKGEPLVTAMQQIGSGGILASLWELTEAANVGMQIEMSRISIRQECVEVCEYYHLNPYQMTSAGTVLMVTRDGNALVRCLEESGARAVCLGLQRQIMQK